MPSKSGSHGDGVSARSSVNVAGLAKTTMAIKVRPQMPSAAALCASANGAVNE